MLSLLLFLSLIPAATRAADPEFPYSFSQGKNHLCAIDDEGVICVNNSGEMKDTPKFVKPRAVAVGTDFSCALHEGGVSCWGKNDKGQLNIPPLNKPFFLAANSYDTACAIDQEGVKCWGWLDEEMKKIPALINPRSVVVGWPYICALDDEGSKCWGSSVPDKIKAARFSSLSVSKYGFCYVEGETVFCRDSYKPNHNFSTEGKNILAVSSGEIQGCVITDSLEHICNNGSKPFELPIYWPISFGLSEEKKCLLEERGVLCLYHGQWWGAEYELNQVVLRNGKVAFSIPSIEYSPYYSVDGQVHYTGGGLLGYVSRLLELSSGPRAAYLRIWRNFEQRLGNQSKSGAEAYPSRYFALALTSPLILGTDSEIFRQKVQPAFLAKMHFIHKRLGFENLTDGLKKTPDNAENRKIALLAIEASLQVAKEFVSTDIQRDIADLFRLLGSALQNPEQMDAVNGFVQSCQRLQPSLKRELGNQKTAFLVDTIDLAASWLKEKVK